MNVLLIKYLNYIQLPSIRKSIELGYDGKRQSQRSIGKILSLKAELLVERNYSPIMKKHCLQNNIYTCRSFMTC